MDEKASAEQEPIAEKLDNNSTWARDQQIRDYYYDDSHGYEIYNPEEDEELEENEN